MLDYIHLNPVRAGLIVPSRRQSVKDYPWSSVAGGYALPTRLRAPWLECRAGLEAYGFADDTRGRRRFVERLDRRAAEETRGQCGVVEPPADGDRRMSHLRRGWYWGSQGFGIKLLEMMSKGNAPKPKGRSNRGAGTQRAHDEKTAVQILRAGLTEARLQERELEALPGSDARKVRIARMIRDQTTVSMGWIAERLCMRSAANVSQILKRSQF
jgi:hypothetical protein